MLGNFSYCNPTRLYFGEDALDNLNGELGVHFRLGRVNSQPPSNGFFICRWSGGEALYA